MNTYNFLQLSKEKYYLFLIILFGLICRLYNLGAESFWFDEVVTIHLLPQDLTMFIKQVTTDSTYTRNIVYYTIAYFWMLPFEITEVSIRLLSVIFGVLSIIMVYIVGKNLFDEKIGIISSFLMAISEFQIHYSQEARFYSLFVLLTLLSMHYYILAFRNNTRRYWIIGALINVVLFYTHSYAIFIFATQYIHYLINLRKNISSFSKWFPGQLPLLILVTLSTVPMITKTDVSVGFGSGLAWILPPSMLELMRTVVSYIIPRQHNHSWDFVWVRMGLGIIFLIAGILISNRNKLKTIWSDLVKRQPWHMQLDVIKNQEMKLTILWFLLPVLLPFIYSMVSTPIFVDRYTICATPAFYMLFAYLISKVNPTIPFFVSISALLIIVLPGLQDYYSANTNEQWREVATYVQQNEKRSDVILFTPDENGYQHKSFDWYYQGHLPFCGITSKIEDNKEINENVSNCISGHERFWVIIRGSAKSTSLFSSFFLKTNQNNFYLITEQKFTGISVYLFSQKDK